MHEMSEAEIDRFLGRSGLGVLALADGGDAFAIPLYYGRDEEAFYFHSRHGMKDDFIDSTKEACFLVSSVTTSSFWQSVQAFGKLERLGGKEARAGERILAQVPLPPEWALSPEAEPRRSGRATFVWRLVVSRINGVTSQPSRLDPGVV